MKNLRVALVLAAVVLVSLPCAGAKKRGLTDPNMPELDKKLADTVDPWGVPFSDSLRRWKQVFAKRPEALFAAGLTHDTVKIWPTKYWFRGRMFLPQTDASPAKEIWTAGRTTAAFQVAALPRIGSGKATFTLAVEAKGVRATVLREVFVTCPRAAYPRLASDRWPDPLLPETKAEAQGTDLAAFWVDVAVPAGHPGGVVLCRVTLTGRADGKIETARINVPIRVVPGLDLNAKRGMKLITFFQTRWPNKKNMPPKVLTQMYDLVLSHHLQPANALDRLYNPRKPKDTKAFDEMFAFLKQRGQSFFHLSHRRMTPELYARLDKQGTLPQFAVYSVDEPSHEMLVAKCIPLYAEIKKKFPKLQVYVATENLPGVDKAVDIFMTDLSSHLYDPRTYKHRKHPRLWHYYCHLPIRWQARGPLPLAPNMEIDNPAIEHRIAMWMSHHWRAGGVFIWAGNWWNAGAKIWETGEIEAKRSKPEFPIYPPPPRRQAI